MMKRWIVLLLCVLPMMFTACVSSVSPTTPAPMTAPEASPTPDLPSQPSEETTVKAVWIPFMEVNEMMSSGDVDEAKAAIAACVRDCAEKGFNTLYFHVRANSDAYYASDVFQPHRLAKPLLESGFDPLSFAVEQAHASGLELHAWVNPYRIGADASYAVCEDIFEYSGKWYYDPSSETVRKIVTDGVRELCENYAVDGVQFDDYFYPSGAVTNSNAAPFEQRRYDAYRSSGGQESVADWRRLQVSTLVSAVYAVCHERDGCVFGISPAYNIDNVRDALYADVEEWARTQGYVDYLCPQLYFGFTHQSAPFEQLLTRWRTLERHESVSLLVGLGMYKTGLAEDTYAGYGKQEWANGGDIIAKQVEMLKNYRLDGVAIYSHQSFGVTDDRDAAVIQAETEALCDALSKWQ